MKGDAKVIEYLNKGLRSELTAINQYWLHFRQLNHWGYKSLAKKWREESIEEMHHADRFVDRILFLDGFPNLQVLDPLRIGQTQQGVADSGDSGHQAGRFGPHWNAALATVAVKVVKDTRCRVADLRHELGVVQLQCRLEKKVEIPQIAVAQRMIPSESAGERGLNGDLDLIASGGVVEEGQTRQSSLPDSHRPVAPGDHVLRVPLAAPIGLSTGTATRDSRTSPPGRPAARRTCPRSTPPTCRSSSPP